MSFTIVMLPPQSRTSRSFGERLAQDVPDANVLLPADAAEAAEALHEADAAYGFLSAELLTHAERLRWLQAPMAGPPPNFFHPALVAHPVLVTNIRGTYTPQVAAHGVALTLALARGLAASAGLQQRHEWKSNQDPASYLLLTEATVLLVGVGAVGAEMARMLAPFGCTVIGTDARLTAAPESVSEIYPAEQLEELLPSADVVIVTVPHTPTTVGMFNRTLFELMKPGAYLVNIGRGPVINIDDLAAVLHEGHLRGAALDVVPEEPLDAGHPIWDAPGIIITPHIASAGRHDGPERYALLAENARRFGAGMELINVVDKTTWF